MLISNKRRAIGLLSTVMIFLMALVPAATTHQEQAPTSDPLLKDVTGSEIETIVNSYRGQKAVLINVWATWCAPCVEEFPEIVKLQRAYPEKLQVIFISGDFPDSRARALAFLKKQDVDWTTYFKTGDDQEFIESVSPNWTGALPFSKVISMDGEVIASWEQSATYDKFERHVKTAINQ